MTNQLKNHLQRNPNLMINHLKDLLQRNPILSGKLTRSQQKNKRKGSKTNQTKSKQEESEESQETEEEGEEFEVEYLVAERIQSRRKEYLVKWKDYPSEQNSWVWEEDIHAQNLIEEMRKKNWTPEQLKALKQAQQEVPADTHNYWTKIAALIPGRTSQECQDKASEQYSTPERKPARKLT